MSETREQIIAEIMDWQPIRPNGDNPVFNAMFTAMNQAKLEIIRHIQRSGE